MLNAFVPKEQLGGIRAMPGLGRDFITLSKFQRDGLAPLGGRKPHESNMFTNARLAMDRRHGWLSRERRCAACNRTFAELSDNRNPALKPDSHSLVLLVPNGRPDAERYFCWDCAASRETLVEVCGEPFTGSIAEDGDDVFAFVAQTIYEDRLADELGIKWLQCHHGKHFQRYANIIGGRLLKLRDEKKFDGPLRPPDADLAATITLDRSRQGQTVAIGTSAFGETTIAAESEPRIAEMASERAVEPLSDDPEVQIERAHRLAKVLARPEQVQFRTQLLVAYDSTCAISGCDVPEALDAAHIQPFYEGGPDTLENGLLLRADLHSLFDRNLIAIDHERMVVIISPSLRESEYKDLEGREFQLPSSPAVQPSSTRLHAHRLKLRS
jgi:hypothetical protein